MHGIISLFSPRLPGVLTRQLVASRFRASTYLGWFWHAHAFTAAQLKPQPLSIGQKLVRLVLQIGMTLQIAAGGYLIYLGLNDKLVGGLAFGLATIIAYPVVWAHLLVVPRIIYITVWSLFHPKKAGKSLLCSMLERHVRRLRRQHKFKVVAVVGSVGKTSTKLAIAKTLGATRRVRFQEGNYNDRLTVPLIFFDRALPGLMNIPAWISVLRATGRRRRDYPYDFVIVELGTDGPGQIAQFAYLEPELAVVTAVADEHMEFFGTLDAVAEEELTVFDFAKQVLVNVDNTPANYLAKRSYRSYGMSPKADYKVGNWQQSNLESTELNLKLSKGAALKVTVEMIGRPGVLIALAAGATAAQLGLKAPAIKTGLEAIEPFAGRMRTLKGSKQSTIIDDSYNASPVAVKAGLDVLYAAKAPQRIAILGNMNELGELSAAAHQEIGEYCKPAKLDYVVTIGPDAEQYLAPAALGVGCKVKSFDNPYAAGEFVKDQLRRKAVILVEGSQNRVFAEEAVKVLLADEADSDKLVRQSSYWMAIKRKQFKV